MLELAKESRSSWDAIISQLKEDQAQLAAANQQAIKKLSEELTKDAASLGDSIIHRYKEDQEQFAAANQQAIKSFREVQ